MSFIGKIRGWLGMLLDSRVKEEFDVIPISSEDLDNFIERCIEIYNGNPAWLDGENHIKTINMAKSVCSEVARLTMLATGINLEGSARAEWLQTQLDAVYSRLRHWVEFGCGYGTIILKPNGDGIDMVLPGQFRIIDQQDGKITGVVFKSQEYEPENRDWFTRIEYHRFVNRPTDGKRIYAISNRCYIGKAKHDANKPIAIEKTPWAGLLEDVYIENVDKPLFGVFRTPAANNVDVSSPMGLPIFAEALTELEDLDVAYSRNATEIYDSKRLVLLDADRLTPTGGKVRLSSDGRKVIASQMGLPDYIKTIEGTGSEDVYHEINPSLNTDVRRTGINDLLSMIGYKCGFSNGAFVLDEKSGVVTATEVESDDRRTIQLIKDVRDQLQNCLNDLFYSLDKMADLYGLAPAGPYEVQYDFGDITYSYEEDKARWYSYVTAGKVPFWYYLVKFEGFTEEEAKALEKEAQPKETLFGGEE